MNKVSMTIMQNKPQIVKRTMLTGLINIAKNAMPKPISTTLLIKKVETTNTQCTFASAHGGKLKQNVPSIKPTITASEASSPVQADLSGYHYVAVVAICNKPDCKHNNCATGSEQENPCKAPAEYHQTLIKEDPYQYGITYELAGSLTHKIPPDKDGHYVYHTDAQGLPKPQLIVKEKGITPIDPNIFTEKVHITELLQNNISTTNILDALPPESVINQANPGPSKIPGKHVIDINNIPLDDGF